nr:hypothetical protein [Arcobacter sp. F2176]
MFKIAVVITSFFDVSIFSLVFDSFASSRTALICKIILLFVILGFTFSLKPISSLLNDSVVPEEFFLKKGKSIIT